MKNRILIGLGILLLVGAIACGGIFSPLWDSLVYAEQQHNTTSSNIMIVFYTIEEGQYLWWCDLSAEIIDNGNGTWDVLSPQITASGINQALITYGYYQFKSIEPEYDEEGNSLLIYMDDLDLQPPAADDLPHSQHIGKLTAVNTALARPATVTRKWHGMTFDVQCLVSQSVVNMWIADTLNVGDYVIVSFIEEIPDTEEVNIAIVVDKVYESWE
jgi:hypothetical protein